jgi:hypothetical protein
MKSEDVKLPVAMSFGLCRVTLIDLEGVRHTVEVTASTPYEAVALGLMAIREHEWAGNIADGLNTVDVSVNNVPVTHSVMMQNFAKWLHRNGETPREITH